MRVLHIETGRHLYGGARQVGNLVAGLGRLEVENLLVCVPGHPLAAVVGAGGGADPARAGARPAGRAATVLPLACAGDLDFGFQRRLRRLIREHAPDLVHVHSRRGADLFGGRAAAAEGVPALLTRRVESREPGRWIRFKLGPYAAVVPISSVVDAELAAAGVLAARRHRIASAVDHERFRPDLGARARLLGRFGLPEDAIVAGAAAQLVARKGLAVLVPLVARLIQREPRFGLLIFGQGPQRARLERQIHRAGLSGCVMLAGYTADWPALLPGLDLLLHPARREGLGSVILEAMSAGVPVVAAAAGGIPDLLEDAVDGRLVAGNSLEIWQAAVAPLLADAEARRTLAARARLTVAARFTIDRMAARYLKLYRHVLG